MEHDVFISFKNSDESGRKTIDSEIAKKLYDFLTKKGLRVFFSDVELEFIGKAQYSRVIDEALDASRFLIAVGSSYKNLDSEWVYYEWNSFLNDIRSGRKPNAEVFVLFSGMKVTELPRALRQQQAFNADEKDSYERLYGFIKNALGKRDGGKTNSSIDDVLAKKAKEEQERLEQEKRKREEAERLEKLKKEREERNRLKREKIFQEIKKYSKYLWYILGGIVVIGLIILAINKCKPESQSGINIVINEDTVISKFDNNVDTNEQEQKTIILTQEEQEVSTLPTSQKQETTTIPTPKEKEVPIVSTTPTPKNNTTKTETTTLSTPQKQETAINPTPKEQETPKTPTTNAKGVLINGVRWATSNVDTPGTFAPTPESAGKFYQWNRKTAWATTGNVSDWDKSTPSGSTWEKINDPSPQGWRIPTKTELQSLLDKTKVTNEWTTQNGVTGRKFTDKATGNSLFFPAAGWRSLSDGTLYSAGTYGYYWSSTGNGSIYAYYMYFNSNGANVGSADRTGGLSVRSVAE